MLTRYVLSSAFAVMCAGAVAGAQTVPPQQPPQQPQSQPRTSAMDQAATTTVEGCVYREKDIPGRSPNVAERAGILEDYILVASADTAGTPGATGTSGTATAGTMPPAAGAGLAPRVFKLEHAADQTLSAMVGKRVRVTGKMDVEKGDTKAPAAAPEADRSPGPDKIELPEFEVSTISETTGECPAIPAIRK